MGRGEVGSRGDSGGWEGGEKVGSGKILLNCAAPCRGDTRFIRCCDGCTFQGVCVAKGTKILSNYQQIFRTASGRKTEKKQQNLTLSFRLVQKTVKNLHEESSSNSKSVRDCIQ